MEDPIPLLNLEEMIRNPLKGVKNNQEIAKGVLKNLGYSVDVVSNGKEALSAIEDTVYNLKFMDIQMPIMNGLEAFLEIKKLVQIIMKNGMYMDLIMFII